MPRLSDSPDSPPSASSRRVIALILAAGQSRRMGRPKMLLPYEDGTILEAVIDAVLQSSVDGLIIVTTPAIGRDLEGELPEDCHVCVNRESDSEMLRSVQIGLERMSDEFSTGSDDAALVLLGDQPQVKAGVITSLAEAYRLPRKPPGILIARYGRRRGHPSIFAMRVISEIRGWGPDRRLNELAQLHPEEVREFPITLGPMPIDVNTPEDYDRLTDSP